MSINLPSSPSGPYSVEPMISPELPGPRSGPRPGQGTFRALKHRNYRLYFLGQIISLTGSWVQTAALTWLAYRLTSGSSLPAGVSAAQVVPMLLLGVWGGTLADRWPRRTLIFLAQFCLLLLALLLAAMVYLDIVTAWALLAVSFVIGVVNAIDMPARLAFVIDMVGRDDLRNAIALNSLVFNVARAVGPALGVLVLPIVGLAGCFFLNGLTFVAVLLALAAMRLPARSIAHHSRPPGSLGESVQHLRGRPGLMMLLVLAGALAFFGWPVLSLLPAHANQSLDAGYPGYAWMLSAIGFGALGGALFVATFGTAARQGAMIALGVGLGAISLAGLALAPSLPVAVVWSALAGGGLILFFATAQTAMQLGAGEHNRGTIMGIWLMVLAGALPAGNLVAGFFADWLGVPTVLLAQAAGIAVAGTGVGIVALLTNRRG